MHALARVSTGFCRSVSQRDRDTNIEGGHTDAFGRKRANAKNLSLCLSASLSLWFSVPRSLCSSAFL